MGRMDQPFVRRHDGSYHWEGVDVLEYKQEGSAPLSPCHSARAVCANARQVAGE